MIEFSIIQRPLSIGHALLPTVREINDLGELAALRGAWKALLAETPGASFFQSLDWLEAYWSHFGAGQRLRVLAVQTGDQPLGILPLVVRTRGRIGLLRVLTYPLDDWGSFYGPIGADASVILRAGLEHIRRTTRDWDLIELPWVDAAGGDRGRTRQAMHDAGLGAFVERGQDIALIDLAGSGDWQAYWSSRTSRWRNNVRRSEKKLAQRGEVTYLRYRPITGEAQDPRWDLYNECERIAAASWQGSSSTGTTLTHAEIRPFLRDCHQRAAAVGAVDLNLLSVNGRAVAFNYAYHHAGYVFGLRTGYDATAECEGAGSVLQARMIEDCFARGDRTYDLGPGYAECKRYWQTETRFGYRYTHFPSHVPIAQLVRAKRSMRRLLGGRRLTVVGNASS
jgi:CelD/BcsL family acetyltransferase involved in cellulose biosynthesis